MKQFFSKSFKETINIIQKMFWIGSIIVGLTIWLYTKPTETKVKEIAKHEDDKLKNEMLLIMLGKSGEVGLPRLEIVKIDTVNDVEGTSQ